LLKSKKGNLCDKASKFDVKRQESNIEHRLTLPKYPQTNGMMERVNGIIKQATILKNEYQDKEAMGCDLINFLVHYNTTRRHCFLKKELNVRTPLQAIIKWYELKPQIFKIKPLEFKNKLLNLTTNLKNDHQQRGET